VPIDDENVFSYSFYWHPTKPIDAELAREHGERPGDSLGEYSGHVQAVANKSNDYLIDRQAQKDRQDVQRRDRHRAARCGLPRIDGAAIQDRVARAAGHERTRASSPRANVCSPRRSRCRDRGTTPPALNPEDQHVRSASVLLPKDVPFEQAIREAMIPGAGAPLVSV